jgi:hypothetical protein
MRFLSMLLLSPMACLTLSYVSAHTQSQAAQTSESQAPVSGSQSPIPEEVPDEELAPAAVNLDVSQASPLIQALYQATRETKEGRLLDRLGEAKRLISGNAEIKAVDTQGRTALHWAVFGSSYTTNQKVLVAYEEIANELIEHSININREDAYNDTALDYLLYSPNFEMQTLLIEHGATSGFLAAFFQFFNQVSETNAPPTLLKCLRPSRRTLHLEKRSTFD